MNIKGVFQIWMKDGSYHEIDLKECHQWTREGCKHCPDFAAEHADISTGGIGEDNDWTLTIVRTELGEEVIERMIADGAIIARPAQEDEKAMKLLRHAVDRRPAAAGRRTPTRRRPSASRRRRRRPPPRPGAERRRLSRRAPVWDGRVSRRRRSAAARVRARQPVEASAKRLQRLVAASTAFGRAEVARLVGLRRSASSSSSRMSSSVASMQCLLVAARQADRLDDVLGDGLRARVARAGAEQRRSTATATAARVVRRTRSQVREANGALPDSRHEARVRRRRRSAAPSSSSSR